MAMIRMHAAAAQLDHAVTQQTQTRQVELGVAVGAADALGLCGREHAVGADNFPAVCITHQQVLAVIIEQVDVVARQVAAQRSAHFQRKNLKPKPLRLPDFVLVLRPADDDFSAGCFCRRGTNLNRGRVGDATALTKQRPRQMRPRDGRQGKGGIGQFFHG